MKHTVSHMYPIMSSFHSYVPYSTETKTAFQLETVTLLHMLTM